MTKKHLFLYVALLALVGTTPSPVLANVNVPAGARLSPGVLGTIESSALPSSGQTKSAAQPTAPLTTYPAPTTERASVPTPTPTVPTPTVPTQTTTRAPTLSSSSTRPTASKAANVIAPSVGASVDEGYRLGVGDRMRITVYGEPDLSGEYEVSSTGTIALPLVGEVSAQNMGLHDLEKAIATRLADGYLQNPRVSVQITNYRPFFILGEVAKPSSYPYVNGMTVLNAVALAGGYTYRADRKDVQVTHANDPDKKEEHVREDAMIKPGDIIRVPERFF